MNVSRENVQPFFGCMQALADRELALVDVVGFSVLQTDASNLDKLR